MMRAVIVLAVGILQASLMTGIAQAQNSDLSDGFDSFDEAAWAKGDHNLGRSYLDPNNVGASGGNLEVKLPANSLDGGEIRSQGLYGYGSYVARMKLPNAPSSITGFFLYEPPDYASEIDIEIFNDTSRKIMFSTYAAGKQTHTQTMTLPFDPTSGFHDYRFDYAPNSVSFYAGGKLMKRWEGGVPKNPMHLYVNAWYPAWLEGKKPLTDQIVLVDKIGYGTVNAQAATETVKPRGTVVINGGSALTRSRTVKLAPKASDPAPSSGVTSMRFRNLGTTRWSAWQKYSAAKSWTLTAGAGTKTVYVQYLDGAGNVSAVAYDKITYRP